MEHALQVEYRSPDDLTPYARNARTHSAEQVAQIAGSIREFGFTNPILCDEQGTIIAGHGRLAAAQKLGLEKVPCITIAGLTDTQRRALILADNRIAETAGWDAEMLRVELEELTEAGADLDLIGFDEESLDELIGGLEDEHTEGDTEPEEPPANPVSRRGDVWQLGKHQLMCGDSTSAEDVAKLMEGEKADMVFTDPPYGMGKESAGVENDNQNKQQLIAFNSKWIPISLDALKEHASWYCWGTDEGLLDIYAEILAPLIKTGEYALKNLITWEKPHVVGLNSGDRMYHPATEKCLFIMKGKGEMSSFNINADDFSPAMQPLLDYMKGEADRLGLTPQLCAQITGTKSMYQHWFSRSQFYLPTRENYEKLQRAFARLDGFKREYDELKREYDGFKREYDELKREFYAARAYFDNGAEPDVTDVWHCPSPSPKEREHTGGHATPKPLVLCERACKFTAPPDGLVVDLFTGSGTTIIAAENTGRRAYGMELAPAYVDVSIKRWQQHTGQQATLDGKTFDEVAQERAQ